MQDMTVVAAETLDIAQADSSNTITIKNFDLAAALNPGGPGCLGIKLGNSKKLVIKEGGGSNPFANPNYNPAGQSEVSFALVQEGSIIENAMYLIAVCAC